MKHETFGVRRQPAGVFRHQVHILQIPNQLDDQGQKASPPEICWPCVPCKIETLSGRSVEQARALYENADYRITIDYLEGVNTRHRLLTVPGDRQFHIGHVSNTNEENVELVLLCSEVR